MSYHVAQGCAPPLPMGDEQARKNLLMTLFVGGILALVLFGTSKKPRQRRNPSEAQLFKKVLDLDRELKQERDPDRREYLKTQIDWYNQRLHKKAPTKYPPIGWVMARRRERGW